MSDQKTNIFEYQTKIFNPEFRFTPGGKAVFNAGFSFGSKPNGDDSADWENLWWDLTAWEELAEQMSNDVQHKDELLLRGRVGARSWRNNEGGVSSKQVLTVSSYEKVGGAPARSTKPAEDNDVPF